MQNLYCKDLKQEGIVVDLSANREDSCSESKIGMLSRVTLSRQARRTSPKDIVSSSKGKQSGLKCLNVKEYILKTPKE
jgi:hypothetical protein